MFEFAKLHNAGLICAFSSRSVKNMSLFYGDTKESLTNRNNFLKPLGIDYRHLACAKQIHSSRIQYVKEEDKGRGALTYDTSIADTDALITDKKNLPLAIFTADCLSIFLYDSVTPAVGLIHAGRRSTQENITTKAVELMQSQFNTKTANLYAGFGPAIRNCCYEVEDNKGSRYYFDLIELNRRQLLELEVREENIFDSSICTSCKNTEFFSYRKEGNACGRLLSVIMLK